MEKAISIHHLSMSYGNRQVLRDVSFDVQTGHIHGLLGPNGAGKTTTMKSIIGLVSPQEGELIVQGIDRIKSKKKGLSVGYLLEMPPLYDDLSVLEFLYYLGRLHAIKGKTLDARVLEVMKLLDIEDIRERRCGNLSKGYKQRLGIAQAIIHSPEIVILDEPTLGLDPQTVIEIRNFILKLKNDHTVLISSHQLHEMSLICDEVSILVDGAVIETGTIEGISEKLSGMHKIDLDILIQTDCDVDDKFKKELLEQTWIKLIESKKHHHYETITITPSTSEEVKPRLIELAVEQKIKVIGLQEKKLSLEELFINITGEK